MKRKFSTLNRHGKTEKSKAIRKLDTALSNLIRGIEGSCATCGQEHAQYDCGHFRRRECMATRFDYRNVAKQGQKENRFEGGRPYEFALYIDRTYGEGTAKKLHDLSRTTKQWEVKELEQLTTAAKHSFLAYKTLYDEITQRTA